ncbi:MAG: AAA family ATPase, partial [Methylomonas sp.]
MAKKSKTAYVCTECGTDYPGWAGQCNQCGEWNTIKELKLGNSKPSRDNSGYAGSRSQVQLLSEVNLAQAERLSSGLSEFDRVLGGGIVKGSVVLIGGAPGAGKSTILLQAIAHIAQQRPVLYVSGEESLQQIAERAHRLGLPTARIKMLAETSVQQICQVLDEEQPQVVIIDSIQVMYTADSDSAPGSVSQVRETASYLT